MKRSLIVLFALAMLAACSGGSDDGAEVNKGSGSPSCQDVWVEGETLPDDYAECDDDGTATGASLDCPGNGKTHATWDLYWSFTGEPIRKMDDEYRDAPDGDPEYEAAFEECVNG